MNTSTHFAADEIINLNSIPICGDEFWENLTWSRECVDCPACIAAMESISINGKPQVILEKIGIGGWHNGEHIGDVVPVVCVQAEQVTG